MDASDYSREDLAEMLRSTEATLAMLSEGGAPALSIRSLTKRRDRLVQEIARHDAGEIPRAVDDLLPCLCKIGNPGGYDVGTMPCPKHSPIDHVYEQAWTAPDGTAYIKRWRLDEQRRRVLNFVPAE